MPFIKSWYLVIAPFNVGLTLYARCVLVTYHVIPLTSVFQIADDSLPLGPWCQTAFAFITSARSSGVRATLYFFSVLKSGVCFSVISHSRKCLM